MRPIHRVAHPIRGSCLLLLASVLLSGCETPEATAYDTLAAGSARTVPTPVISPGPQTNRQIAQSRTTAVVKAAERVAPSVVSINVIRRSRTRARTVFEDFFTPPQARRTSALGSGFIVDASGTILTNDHVIAGAERILVTLPDGREIEPTVVGTDAATDLAVLRIELPSLPVAALGTSRGLMIGEWTIAIGNPFGQLISNSEPSVTVGVVSAVGRHIVPAGGDEGIYLGMIQTDAAINPGNSGGPLVNALGEVIGINSSIFSRGGGSEGLGFAIPIDRALKIADNLIRFGEVRRAWLGLDVDAVEADAFGRTRGVTVARVFRASPAEAGGIRTGDRLLMAAGRRLATPLDFEAVLLDLRAGDELTVTIDGRSQPVRMVAEELPSATAARVELLQDLEVVTLTPQIRAERGMTSEQGAVIVGISDNLAGRLGLQVGDVLVQINNSRLRTAEDAAAALRQSQETGRVSIYFERNGSITYRRFYWRR